MDPMLELVHGLESDKATNLNRLADAEANIKNLRKEFIGMPTVCYALAGVIVRLRRDHNNIEHIHQFHKLLNTYKHTLLQHLDVRWLLSICDTFVDIGDLHRSAVAMNIVQCVNDTNIHMTILANVQNGQLDYQKLAQEIKIPTWGGMITADIPTGDMIYNMITRLNRVVSKDPLLDSIWQEIKSRGKGEAHIVMNHFCAHSKIPHQQEYYHDNK